MPLVHAQGTGSKPAAYNKSALAVYYFSADEQKQEIQAPRNTAVYIYFIPIKIVILFCPTPKNTDPIVWAPVPLLLRFYMNPSRSALSKRVWLQLSLNRDFGSSQKNEDRRQAPSGRHPYSFFNSTIITPYSAFSPYSFTAASPFFTVMLSILSGA